MGLFGKRFGSGREKKWFDYGFSTDSYTSYLFCTRCNEERSIPKKEFPKDLICRKCQSDTTVILRPINICFKCHFAFAEIDYELDSGGNRVVCPNCNHAEYSFRNKSIYLPDTKRPLHPRIWIEEFKRYSICSLNKDRFDAKTLELFLSQ